MATIFTKIIDGEFPGKFVWKDDLCVAFLSIHPLKPGHTLVVPRAEVDHWIDLDEATMTHVMRVARILGQAIQQGFQPLKVGLMLAGLEVPHVHVHLVPIGGVHDLDFAHQDTNPNPADLDRAAATIREQLTAMGRSEVAG